MSEGLFISSSHHKYNEKIKFVFQFYITETQCELYCRDLLFMALFLESPDRMGLQGNTLH